jgi:endonuclease III related protein
MTERITIKIDKFLEDIYLLLLNKFGFRNWWPGDTQDEIIIGAILTQNVNWSNVEKAIENLKQNCLLNLKSIHESEISRIAPLIKPTRFYNQKCIKLKNFSDYLFSNYSGSLDSMFGQSLETLRQELLNLKGLGNETVDSILLYAGGKPIFVVDTYTQRILSKLGVQTLGWQYKEYQRFFMKNLKTDVELYKDFHAQIVYWGHNICKAKERICLECPIVQNCKEAKLKK